jgi:hypothetical protein
MPNWCMNVATISHTEPRMITLIKDAALSENFFQTLRPRPESQKENWYEWNLSNWGTKWDVSLENFVVEPSGIRADFDTAWGPPIAFLEHLVEMGYVVECFYYEPGMCFVGCFRDGFDDYYEYSDIDADKIRDHIGEELDDVFGISESALYWQDAENEEIELPEDLLRAINEQDKA